MASVVKGVVNAIKEKGVGGFLRELRGEGYLKCILDGNLLQTKIHNIGATVVGVDKFGNKYYEKLGDTQYGLYLLFLIYHLHKLKLLLRNSVCCLSASFPRFRIVRF
ncbi:unnamed protein product [Linum tenue]|uniref:NADH dehydrogenase [ubiquinone] 1 alpha subcomplex subunit 12 n=1 Tax=Linum tenue TaxID=586396 RepID=A0AAV0RFK9_9ROSI|nr:unnamed protein product [Linum tenue]